MKKIILALCLVLVASPCFAFNSAIQAVCGASADAPALTCTGETIQQQETTDNGNLSLGNYTSQDWAATKITYTGTTGAFCQLKTTMHCSTNDCAQVITAHLYADNAGAPGAKVASCSGTYDTAPLTTTPEEITFTGCSGTLTNGVTYWLAWNTNSANSTNYPVLEQDATCAVEVIYYGGDDTSWASASTTVCINHKIYITE